MSYMIKYIYRKYKIIYLDNTRAYNNNFISGLGVSNVQRCNNFVPIYNFMSNLTFNLFFFIK